MEASGLAASRRTARVLWTHNDSGDAARLFAIRTDGTLAATVAVEGAEAIDWEAIASAPAGGLDSLYIGDIGDNNRERQRVTVYVVNEPELEPAPTRVAVSRRIDLQYEDGPQNAEAMLVDPRTSSIVVVTKASGGGSSIYLADVEAGLLRNQGQLPFTKERLGASLVTDGSVSPDGSLIALRTYSTAFLFRRVVSTSLVDALEGTPCPLSLEPEPQGESIAFADDGAGYFTLSEKPNQPLFFYDLK